MSEDITRLSEAQLDALKEIGNVGAGNADTALSQLIKRRVDMSVPQVAILPLGDVPNVVGGPDVMVVGVYLKVYGSAPGSILFLLPRDSAYCLVDTLMGRNKVETPRTLDQMDQSALLEIGNILSGAYLNALSHFTKFTLLPSIPALAMDMAGAILSVILVQLGQMGDHALVIETEFSTENDGVKGHFFLIPDPGSLVTILESIGMKE